MAIDKIFNDANVDGIADNIFGAVNNSVSEVKQMQQRKAAENVQMVVEAFKKIETNITEKFDNVTDVIEKRVLTIKDGRDGLSGSDGRNGRDGKPGRDGVNGKQGIPGTPGKDGVDGEDGVSVTNANIDFDGSLIISLSTGQEINVGEVVSPDLADKIQVISTMSTNGAVGIKDEGTSISSGVKIINFVGANITATNSGDDVTVTVAGSAGTVTSVAATVPSVFSISGSPITTSGTLALTYSGTALPVANGGTGITSLGTGVATFLGTPSSANLAAALTDETGTGSAVFATSPTLVTPALGTPSSGIVTNLTGTASININGTVGATTPATGAFTTVSATNTITQTGSSGTLAFNQNQSINAAIVNKKTATSSNSLGAYDEFATKDNTGTTNTWAAGVNVNSVNSSWELYNGGTRFSITQAGAVSIGGNTAVTGTLSATGTLSGGTSGTAYSFSGSAPATSLTLDSSGNLGVGVTPSAWKSNYKATQVGNATAVVGRTDSNNNYFSSNWFVNSSNQDIYQNTGFATIYSQGAGTHAWYNAASGTGGNIISFGNAKMTLDASGNLGVGTTSPTTLLTVSGTGATGLLTVNRTDGSGFMSLNSANGVAGAQISSTGGQGLQVYTNMATSPVLAITLDSSGNLIVGGTLANNNDSSSFGFNVANGNQYNNHISGTGSGTGYIQFSLAGTVIGSITQSGTTAVLYNLTSDQRLKENIQDAAPASALIDAIQVRQFDWITDKTHQRYGFIAQELVTVAPEAVYQPIDPEEMMAVDYSKLVPLLVKELQSLRARVAQLESKL